MLARHGNFMLKNLARLTALLCLFMALGASAQPFDFLAVYEPLSGSGEAHAVRLDVSEDSLLPDGGEHHQLDRIVVRFKSDAVSASALASFSGVKFTVRLNGSVVSAKTIKLADLEKLPNREAALLSWSGDGVKEALTRVQVEAQAIYAAEFLCIQEKLLLADAENKKEAKLAKVPREEGNHARFVQETEEPREITVNERGSPKAVNEGNSREAKVQERKLLKVEENGPWILYSFCRQKQPVDWDELASGDNKEYKEYKFGQSSIDSDGKSLFKAHKQALAKKVVDQLNKSFPSFSKSEVDTDEAEFNDALVHVGYKRAFSVIKSAGALMLMEESSGDVHRLSEIIDQDSEVSLGVDREVCLELPPGEVLQAPWTFEMEVPDKADNTKTKRVKLDLDFRDGCRRKLVANWQEFVEQRVTFRLIYRVPDHEDIIVLKDSFDVHNLGLITTAPVFSEINSAFKGTSLRDVEATSSIPVSFALSVKEQRKSSYAVTFPFTLSVNTRSFPNLAEYFALAPSISLIAGGATEDLRERGTTEEPPPVEQGPSMRLAIGMGVNVARAFHFGYAWAPSDGGRYVLIGISVPDLLPLFKESP